MRLHRFYIPEPVGSKGEVTIGSAEQVHQLRRVFRLGKSDRVIVFDGSGSDYECEIIESTEKSVALRVASSSKSRFVPAQKIILAAALVKKDNFEFIVEKAAELGVTDIIPVLAERSEKKAVNEERLKKIAIEASEQSGRGTVPAIHGIVSLEDSIKMCKRENADLRAFHTEGKMFSSGDITKTAVLGIFIGPEGGWSPVELDLFHKNDVPVVCLGTQVLRAETAVIAALSLALLKN